MTTKSVSTLILRGPPTASASSTLISNSPPLSETPKSWLFISARPVILPPGPSPLDANGELFGSIMIPFSMVKLPPAALALASGNAVLIASAIFVAIPSRIICTGGTNVRASGLRKSETSSQTCSPTAMWVESAVPPSVFRELQGGVGTPLKSPISAPRKPSLAVMTGSCSSKK